MNDKFIQFLHKLENEQNKSLIESVRHGYSVIFEGYADVSAGLLPGMDS